MHPMPGMAQQRCHLAADSVQPRFMQASFHKHFQRTEMTQTVFFHLLYQPTSIVRYGRLL